jgi:hypothetical protein
MADSRLNDAKAAVKFVCGVHGGGGGDASTVEVIELGELMLEGLKLGVEFEPFGFELGFGHGLKGILSFGGGG